MFTDSKQLLEERIDSACRRAARERREVTLVAVTKGVGIPAINEAIGCGQADIGENRVQEYLAKKEHLNQHRFHLIGHLQTNKVRHIVSFVHLIHSVDSLHLAMEIARRAGEAGRRVPVLLEVNTSGEEAKFGMSPEQARKDFEKYQKLREIEISGLMTVAALEADPELVRPAFVLLRELRDALRRDHGISLPHLSMGMSNDFEVAIEEGATLIRVGTALFGRRN